MMPKTVATWYATSRAPRTFAGADSATNTGTTTTEMPMVRPSSSRAMSSVGTSLDMALSTAKSAYPIARPTMHALRPTRLDSQPPTRAPSTSPATTAVVTSSCWDVVRLNCLVMNSRAPAMLDMS
ncbi:hypothetical protein StoSoilA2_23150 [Arthrobacter sp. StoSoilA2]|nr:hypothetical protein StoSoilA2_23150 [Arthrobacter sp. StoSoilA2]